MFLLAFILLSSLHLLSAATIDDEMDALMRFKQSLVDPHGHLHNWVLVLDATGAVNYSSSPCRWTGVQCSWTTTESEKVVVGGLDLSNMNLSGTVSASLGQLRNLGSLSLAANNLTGPLPPELCDIGPVLRYLNVSNNLLGGAFPAQNLSNLASLRVLDAYNNNFTGPLPLQLSKLSALRHVHLGGNYFEGSIPPQYGSLLDLTYLALSGNSLSGRIPVELGNLAFLTELYLGYYNQFDGGIPSALGRLTELVRLDMANCGLSGPIPPQLLHNLTKLDSLFLQINSLTGPLPSQLSNLVSLRSLDLSNNFLSGHIPPELSSLINLELLNLFRNHIHGPLPDFLARLPSLQVLSLWENNMTGAVPQELGLRQNLLTLDLSSNSFSGPIPPHLCAGASLERLVLFNNRFSGVLPDSLGRCRSLVRMRVGQNNLTGPMPAGLLALPSLQMLEAPLNRINGSIPWDIPPNTKLGRLDLSGNLLEGPLPPSITNLSALQTLLLQRNRLSGSIPQQVGSLRRLSKLDLSWNVLSGSIPPALGHCQDLTYIDVSRNELVGVIPPTLRELGVLDYLNLSGNYLSGPIPPSFQQMQTLTSADFSYNNLSGIVPDQGQFATFNASSFAGNPGLCGPQIAPCAFASADERRRAVQSEPVLAYWVIVGTISALTVLVFVGGVVYNRHALCSLLGREMVVLESPWKLTAYQKLDFTAEHVLACLTDDNIIGKGGSGTVYRCLTPGGYVAVKRLPSGTYSKVAAGERMDDHGFSAEIQTLGKIRHRNIVRLLGCCSSKDTNLLVYEYMPNGSLGQLLHGPKGGCLDWAKRYRIAVQAACGLRYLHHDCSPIIVHRDVKSNNILLDSTYEAHVADFGLAKPLLLVDVDYPESMSSVAGSYGYIAPEYIYTLKVDEKSDIYSFGVVLLELLTGRRPFEPEFGEGVDIAHWVRKTIQKKHKEGVREVVDRRLGAELQENPRAMAEAMAVLKVALLCLVELPMQRPTMQEVVQMLTDVNHGPSKWVLKQAPPHPAGPPPPDLMSM